MKNSSLLVASRGVAYDQCETKYPLETSSRYQIGKTFMAFIDFVLVRERHNLIMVPSTDPKMQYSLRGKTQSSPFSDRIDFFLSEGVVLGCERSELMVCRDFSTTPITKKIIKTNQVDTSSSWISHSPSICQTILPTLSLMSRRPLHDPRLFLPTLLSTGKGRRTLQLSCWAWLSNEEIKTCEER